VIAAVNNNNRFPVFTKKGKLVTSEIKSVGMRSLARRCMDKIDHIS
jgi:hypothetical protein